MNTAQMMAEENISISGIGLNAEPTLVVGMGKTGLSCVRFLEANGIPVAVTDSRVNPPCLEEFMEKFSHVRYSIGGFDSSLFEWAKHLMVSPGVSIDEPMIAAAGKRGVEIIGDVELFARVAHAPIVAITGSNGKSTVTTLVAEMAKNAGKDVLVGGNIGTPALDLLSEDEPDLYVLELSSFQLETTRSLNAAVSVVLNVSPDHMDRYHDFNHYSNSKQRIFGIEGSGHGKIIVNRDDKTVMSMAEKAIRAGRECISFGLNKPTNNNFGRVNFQNRQWLVRGDEKLISVDELRLAGEHNQANVLAALALGEQVDLPMIAMLDVLRSFSGLPHRTQWIANIGGVSWYNDSKGTNVGATNSAIQGFSQPIVLIAGGQSKGADFSSLRKTAEKNIRAVILIGEDALRIKNALKDAVPIMCEKNMQSAVLKAQEISKPGDVVLLSPACASFDMYAGFEERGDDFVNAVNKLQYGDEL